MALKDYYTGWVSCIARVTQIPSFRKCFENASEALDLKAVESMISVGAGTGNMDILFMSEFLPNLKRYEALEPDDKNFKELQASTKAFTDMNVVLHKCTDEEWSGPSDLVDCVFVLHMLYHAADIEATVRRCLTWLKTGKNLILIIKRGDGPIEEIWRHFKVPEQTRNGVVVKEILEKASIPLYAEFSYTLDWDVSEPDSDFIEFLLLRKPSKKEDEEMRAMLKDVEKKGEFSDPNDVIVIKKN